RYGTPKPRERRLETQPDSSPGAAASRRRLFGLRFHETTWRIVAMGTNALSVTQSTYRACHAAAHFGPGTAPLRSGWLPRLFRGRAPSRRRSARENPPPG